MNTGGPAFPTPDTVYPNGQVQFGGEGITMLDWFAGKAMQSMAIEYIDGREEHFRNLAVASYQIADAMIAERDRRTMEEKP